MASRASGKRSARGPSSHTGNAPSRSHALVTALSLLSDDLAEIYNKKFKNKSVINQYVYSPLVARRMCILDVVERISFQGIDLFLNCITEYNEELVKLFYTEVVEQFKGFIFFCNIGTYTVEVNDDVWKSLFEISQLSSPTDLKITNSVYAPDYDFRTALNKMLRKPFAPEVVQSILFPTNVTTRKLKPLDRILHWIVMHILHPKQGGYSCVDIA